MIITYKFRLSDKHSAELNRQARAVNFVWNYCNEIQRYAVRNGRKWLLNFDLQILTASTSEELGLHSHTIKEICKQYYLSRNKHKRAWLRFRSKKSLKWIPFSTNHVRFDGTYFNFRRIKYKPMHYRDTLKPGMKIHAGSFNADSQGKWYINIPIEIEYKVSSSHNQVGIDLGLKTLATLSNGEIIEMPSFYRESEKALGMSYRARKSKRAKTIHAKVRNRRKDFLHKASHNIAMNYSFIAVGDVSPSAIIQKKIPGFAKSVYDASWFNFKQMLSYKSIMNGGRYIEVNEQYTSQTCSSCGDKPDSRPRGIAGLGIREWTCSSCGAVLNRDVNAALNILRLGQQTLAGGAV